MINTKRMNEYEKEREERIRSNRARMAALELPSLAASIATSEEEKRRGSRPAPSSRGISSKRKRGAESEAAPRRRSARLQGEAVDGAEVAEETRKGIIVSFAAGGGLKTFGKESPPSSPRERHPKGDIPFKSANAPGADEEFLKFLDKQSAPIIKDQKHREAAEGPSFVRGRRRGSSGPRSSKEKIRYDQIETLFGNRELKLAQRDVAKVVQNSVTHMAFHPTVNSLLLASADKRGNLGLWLVDSEELSKSLKRTSNSMRHTSENGNEASKHSQIPTPTSTQIELEPPSDADDADATSFDGVLSIPNIHYQYVSGLKWAGSLSANLYSCSYDGSVRCLDAFRAIFSSAWSDEDMEYSCMDLTDDARTLLIGTNLGDMDVIDLRAKKRTQASLDIHDRKVNTVHIDPVNSVHFVTASTDTTLKLWDLRKFGPRSKPLCSGAHKQTCQAAYLSPDGSERIVSTSFDNTVRVWDGKKDMKEIISVRHDNQTGRWVMPFRAIWAPDSAKVIVGNMKRCVDVIDASDGSLTSQLMHGDYMTAIPARNCVHPSLDVLASGTASGRLHVFR